MPAASQNLPINSISREIPARSSIFAICFSFLFSIAPHFRNLPLWVSLMVLVALGWRCLESLGKFGSLPKWLLILLVMIGGVGVFAEYWTIVGRDAGLALLTVMTGLKLLESRCHRDMLILIFLCYFLIAIHFLFSQSIITAILMFVTLVVITATLVMLNQREEHILFKELLLISTRLVLLSIPLMLILFFLVPRVPGPLWGLTSEQRGGITGLSDHMSPGKISNLIRNNEVAFRVDFDSEIPPQHRLYWRGPVMVRYNGYRWSQEPRKVLRHFSVINPGPTAKYTVTLEPNGEAWLFALDLPTTLIPKSTMTEDFQIISQRKINDLLRYPMESQLTYRFGLTESRDYLALALEYPEDLNPKTIALGKSLATRFKHSEDIASEVLDMFRKEAFFYTLTPPALGKNVVDEFLFGSRRGFCEHYAGSFALLMRAAGIPSRIVTGYQGGEYNAVGGYLIIRQSDAHAWTEIWIENRGWVRIDPTAAVSPDRIEQGLDEALSDETSGFRIRNRNPLFGNLLYGWDSLQHGWNDWVLNYDRRKQMSFLSQLGVGIENWSDMVFALVFLLLIVTTLIWLIAWYRERPPKPAVYEIAFNRLLKKLSQQGFRKRPAEDTRAFLLRITLDDYPQYERLADIIELYNRIKYGRLENSRSELGNLRAMIDSFRT